MLPIYCLQASALCLRLYRLPVHPAMGRGDLSGQEVSGSAAEHGSLCKESLAIRAGVDQIPEVILYKGYPAASSGHCNW